MKNSEFKLTGSDVFGRYCRIEMKNFISPNDFFIHKCIRTYMGNRYRDVPLVAAKGEYVHTGGPIDLVSVITCGIDETEVFAVPLESVEFIPNNERTCHPKGDWKPVSQTQKVRRLVCDCGYEFGVDRENASPFDISIMCELPNFCPNCGARVTRGGER